MDLEAILNLKAEPYTRIATMLEWQTGRAWRMPDLDWLKDECADFIVAGRLNEWLDYWRNFEGMD